MATLGDRIDGWGVRWPGAWAAPDVLTLYFLAVSMAPRRSTLFSDSMRRIDLVLLNFATVVACREELTISSSAIGRPGEKSIVTGH